MNYYECTCGVRREDNPRLARNLMFKNGTITMCLDCMEEAELVVEKDPPAWIDQSTGDAMVEAEVETLDHWKSCWAVRSLLIKPSGMNLTESMLDTSTEEKRRQLEVNKSVSGIQRRKESPVLLRRYV